MQSTTEWAVTLWVLGLASAAAFMGALWPAPSAGSSSRARPQGASAAMITPLRLALLSGIWQGGAGQGTGHLHEPDGPALIAVRLWVACSCRLIDSGEAAPLRDLHCDFYVALAEKGASGVIGPDQVEWVERLETEHDNLRAALAWCQADPDGAVPEERLAGALGRFWRDRGYMREGFEWLTHAATRRPRAVSVGRGRALEWAAIIAQQANMAHEQQAGLLRESVSVLRQAGDPVELSLALRHLWSNLNYGPLGKPHADAGLLEESVAIARDAGDQRDLGWGLLYLAQHAHTRGDLAKARRLADEALPILRGLDPYSLSNGLCVLGLPSGRQEAVRANQRSVGRHRRLNASGADLTLELGERGRMLQRADVALDDSHVDEAHAIREAECGVSKAAGIVLGQFCVHIFNQALVLVGGV
jgi:hypothetical protein